MNRRTPTLLTLALMAAPSGLAAQVGHAPEDSPYRDIIRGSFLVGTVGTFRGSGGKLGVAPHDGHTYGLRFNFMANRPLQIGAGVQYGQLQHFVQNQSAPPETRTTGPVDTDVVWTDVSFQLNLTGGKSWHGIAPYLGAGVGLAFTSVAAPEDTDFDMGNRFYFAPMGGARVFLGQSAYIHLEGRYQFWQISYPESFRIAPIGHEQADALLPGGRLKEWSVTPWLQVGLGWAVSLPF